MWLTEMLPDIRIETDFLIYRVFRTLPLSGQTDKPLAITNIIKGIIVLVAPT
jgi:hypothetical protein